MSSSLRSVTAAVGRHPVVTIVLTVLVTLALASRIPEGELTNDSSVFSPRTPEVVASEQIRERFSSSAVASLQVVVSGDDVVSADGVATVDTVTEVATASFGDALVRPQEGDAAVLSFLTPARAVAGMAGQDLAALDDAGIDRFQQQALDAPTAGAGGSALADLARELTGGDDPVDATTGLVLVQLDRTAFADEEGLATAQADFAAALAAESTPLAAVPFSFELISAPDSDFGAEVGQLFATAALVILLVLGLVLRARRGPVLGRLAAVRRSAADMGASIGAVILAVVWTQGLLVLLGPDYLGVVGQASPPTQIVPILLLALGVDYAIHVQSRYREELGEGLREPATLVERLGPSVGVALFLSVVTTGVGFLTNLASPVPAIRDLGVLAAVGIVAAFVLSITFLPAVRALLDRRAAGRDRLAVEEVAPRETSVFARVATVGLRPALRRPVAVLSVAGVLAAGGAVGLTQLDTEFDLTAFLPGDSPYVAAFDTLVEEFGGGLAETTDVLVTGDVLTPAVHNATGEVAASLDGAAGVVSLGGAPDVTTPVAVFASLEATTPSQEAALAEARALGLREDGTVATDADVAGIHRTLAGAFPAAAGVVDPEPGDPALRITVRTRSEAVGADVVGTVVTDRMAPVVAAGAEVVVTSDAIINDDVTRSLQDSQVRGLVITVVAVMLLLGLVYGIRSRRPGLGALVMVPVVAVVLWVFGLMALTGIPFDPVTAVISALVVGVGVDFCIHLGERFVEDVERLHGDVAGALRSSLRHTGGALAGSAATTMLGFSVLTTASITPFARLGVVTIYAVGLSLAATLFVLPAILVLYGRRQAARGAWTVTDERVEEVREVVATG